MTARGVHRVSPPPDAGRDGVTVLGIETSTSAVGVVVGHGGEVVWEVGARLGPRHAELLMPLVVSALSGSGLGLGDLDAVVVDGGPGLLTGVRVGVATAKALAFGRGLPVSVLSSLEMLVWPLAGLGRPLLAVVDLRRGELAWQGFRPVATGRDAGFDRPGGARPVARPSLEPIGPAAAGPLAELHDAVAGWSEGASGLVAVGDGARRVAEALVALGMAVLDAPEGPSLEAMVALGTEAVLDRRVRAAETVTIDYPRPPDASPGAFATRAGVRATAGEQVVGGGSAPAAPGGR